MPPRRTGLALDGLRRSEGRIVERRIGVIGDARLVLDLDQIEKLHIVTSPDAFARVVEQFDDREGLLGKVRRNGESDRETSASRGRRRLCWLAHGLAPRR